MESRHRDATGPYKGPTVRAWSTVGNPGLLALSLALLFSLSLIVSSDLAD